MADFSNIRKSHYDEDEDVYITCKGRSTFVALSRKFKSKKSKKVDDAGKFAVELIFPPEADLKMLYKGANDAAHEKWAKVNFTKPGVNSAGKKTPFLKAEDKLSDITSKGDAVDLEGWTMLRTTAYTRRPTVRNAQGEELDLDDIEIEAFTGRWMRIGVRFKPYENDQDGVTAYLESVQLLSKDDKIGGGAAVKGEGFCAVDDDDEDEDDDI